MNDYIYIYGNIIEYLILYIFIEILAWIETTATNGMK